MTWLKYLMDTEVNKKGDIVFVDGDIGTKVVKGKTISVECMDAKGVPVVDATPEARQVYLKAKKGKKEVKIAKKK